MHLCEPQRVADRIHFLHKASHVPEGAVIGLIRFATAELIIHDDWPIGGQPFEGFQIIMTGTGSAMEGQQRNTAAADTAIPNRVAIDTDSTFFSLHAAPPPMTWLHRKCAPRAMVRDKCGKQQSQLY